MLSSSTRGTAGPILIADRHFLDAEGLTFSSRLKPESLEAANAWRELARPVWRDQQKGSSSEWKY